MKFTRITVHPDVCAGKPCIRDLRFPVSRLLGLLAARQTPEEILQTYPYLEAADIDEALRYAASLAEDETIDADVERRMADAYRRQPDNAEPEVIDAEAWTPKRAASRLHRRRRSSTASS